MEAILKAEKIEKIFKQENIKRHKLRNHAKFFYCLTWPKWLGKQLY